MSEGQYLYEDWLVEHACCDIRPCDSCKRQAEINSPDICQNRHQGNPESTAANPPSEAKRLLRTTVEAFIKSKGLQGATSDEIEASLNLPHQTVSPRITEGFTRGYLVRGERRMTRSGRWARAAVHADYTDEGSGTVNDATRPKVSGSMSLHCRMEIYLAAHDYPKEPVQPGAQRTFDLGHIVEAAMFRPVPLVSVDDDGGLTEQIVGPWWEGLGEVRDYKTGQSFTASMDQLSGFQRVVSFAGYSGHLDCLLKLDTGNYVVDVKSTQGYGYKRNLTSDLFSDPFAREYVGQLHFYMEGLKQEGEEIAGAVLIYFNKENSATMARFVEYDPAIVEEMKERLSWAKSNAEPEPDWKWIVGKPLELRCSYCSYKQSCAQVRGLAIDTTFTADNKPKWIVKSA